MKLKTSCPSCTASLTVEADLVGKHAKCPKCGSKFVIDEVRTPSSERSLEKSTTATETLAEGSTTVSSASKLTSPAGPSTVKTLGRFEIQGILGQGGFGRVYKAYDPQLDRLLALKVPTFGPQDVQKAKRFQKEAKAAAQLRHPNIVPTYESGKFGNQYFIASQFIEGEPLSKATALGPVDLRLAAEWCAKIADALAYAHELGIIHRDVKPHNVMLDARSEPQLMDFGLARRLSEDSTLTSEGALLGTPAYMAPEQARGDTATIGPHSDQYAAGAILYELTTGQRAFDGPPHIVITQIAGQEPPAPRSLNAQIAEDLQAIIQKAMGKEIARRYGSCEELAADLRAWLKGDPTTARPITALERFRRWAKRNRGLAVAFTATAVALVVVAVLGVAFAGYQVQVRQRVAAAAEESQRAAEEVQKAAERVMAEEQKTLTALNTAESERDRAETAVKDLQIEQQNTVAALKMAETERDRAKSAEMAARERLYVSQMVVAEQAWKDSRVGRVRELLDQQVPTGPDQNDLRGWEWYFQKNLTQQPGATYHNPDWNAYQRGAKYQSFALAPDGRTLAIVTEQNTIQIVGADNPLQVIRTLAGHSTQIWDIAFHPFGKRLVSTDRDGTVIWWDVERGEQIWSLPKTTHGVMGNRASFSADGKLCVVGGSGAVILQTGDQTPRPQNLREGDPSWSRAVAISPDGRTIAAGNPNGVVHLWTNRNTHREIPVGGEAYDLTFDSSGRYVAVAARPGVAALIDIESGKIKWQHHSDDLAAYSAAFGSNGAWVAFGWANSAVEIYDTASGDRMQVLRGHEASVFDLAVTPEGDRLISQDYSGGLRVWETPTVSVAERVLAKVPYNQNGEVSLHMHPRDEWVLAMPRDGTTTAWLYRISDGALLHTFGGHSSPFFDVAVSPDGERIAFGLRNGQIALWDVASATKLREWTAHQIAAGESSAVYEVCFDPNGEDLLSCGFGRVRWWNTETGQQLRELLIEGLRLRISSCSLIDATCRRIAIARNRLTPSNTALPVGGTLVEVRDKPDMDSTSAGQDPPPLGLVSAPQTSGVEIVDLRSGGVVRLLRPEIDYVEAHFSPDSGWLTGLSSDGSVTVWDSESGTMEFQAAAQVGQVMGGFVFDSERRLLTSERNGTARVWDIRTAQEVRTLPGGSATVDSVRLLSDGRRIITAGMDGAIRIWDGR